MELSLDYFFLLLDEKALRIPEIRDERSLVRTTQNLGYGRYPALALVFRHSFVLRLVLGVDAQYRH